jgi:hypothetical protein
MFGPRGQVELWFHGQASLNIASMKAKVEEEIEAYEFELKLKKKLKNQNIEFLSWLGLCPSLWCECPVEPSA